jgi:hypothetical protein
MTHSTKRQATTGVRIQVEVLEHRTTSQRSEQLWTHPGTCKLQWEVGVQVATSLHMVRKFGTRAASHPRLLYAILAGKMSDVSRG